LGLALGISAREVEAAIASLKKRGYNIHKFGQKYSLELQPQLTTTEAEDRFIYPSREDRTYVFGVTTDNHLCSKYQRMDVLNDLYDQFAAAGVDRVYNCGNWIDGEARFNKFDIFVHGMGPQVKYFVDNYPQREGIKTYFIAGDDHEGWYCQREGIDIGRYTESEAHAAGREDLVYIGYMEAFVDLLAHDTQNRAKMLVCHPGGGSSYALSYTSQKSVEAYDDGEKPDIALFGHYHKLEYCYVRGVHAIQCGTTEDQTPFMRKRKLAAHVGGVIVKVTQNPDGTIKKVQVEFATYLNKGHVNGQYNMAGPVNKSPARKR
jgi:hypothetical protein